MNQWDAAAEEINRSSPSVWMRLFTWLKRGIGDLFKTDETRCGTRRLCFTQPDKVNLWHSSLRILLETLHFSVWDFSAVSRACVCSCLQIYVDRSDFFPASVSRKQWGGMRVEKCHFKTSPHTGDLLWLFYINHSRKVKHKLLGWEFGGLNRWGRDKLQS